MNHEILVDKNLVDNIIKLAKLNAEVAYNKYPDGINLTDPELDRKVLYTQSDEEKALKNALDNLTPDQAKELCAIMYLGRDYSDELSVEETFALKREAEAKREFKYLRESLEKTPLGKYLSNGMQLLCS